MADAAKKKDGKKRQLVVVNKKSSDLAQYEPEVKNFVESLKNSNNKMDNFDVMDTLLEKGYVDEEELAGIFSKEFNIEFIENLSDYKISPDILKTVSRKTCERNVLIPLAKVGKSLVVAFSDPSNMHVRDNLSLVTDCKIQPVVATRTAIKNLLNVYYDSQKEIDKLFYNFEAISDDEDDDSSVVVLDNQKLANNNSDTVISLVNLIFSDAIRLKSSDIHIETYEKAFRVRYRIDGILHEKHVFPKEIAAAVVSRIKVISNMDISEKRRPQDARLKISFQGKELNLRVNSTPTVNGEKIVLRILDDSALKVEMSQLGMEKFQMEVFVKALEQPQGLILMTGPTGSGKTTTIYSGLMKLNTVDCNISTAEDPVEFRIHGINQVQINPKVELNFSKTLRAFLRQDPDVILVGEIRDLETAEIAYKAASTGHLVLSTLHTNDTSSTVTRLLSMGIPSYSVSDNTSIIISQRLLRRVCEDCHQIDNIPDNILRELEVKESELSLFKGKVFKKGAGCNNCNNLGYKGRIAVYEMMQVSSIIKQGIFNKLSPKELKAIAVEKDNMQTLRQSALLKLREGFTTAEEVIRATLGDDI